LGRRRGVGHFDDETGVLLINQLHHKDIFAVLHIQKGGLLSSASAK
jgi:hypothetical protein